MGMLKGEIIGEVMAIKIAEPGAQGEQRTFTVISKDDTGRVSTCSGSYSVLLDDGTVLDGDVYNGDLEKSLPVIKETGVVQPFSMVRGHFKTADGKWYHIDMTMGNHFFVRDLIAKDFLDKFAGKDLYCVYEYGIQVVKELLAP